MNYFFLCRRILYKNRSLLYIHLNLAIALLVFYILFVTTVDPARNIAVSPHTVSRVYVDSLCSRLSALL